MLAVRLVVVPVICFLFFVYLYIYVCVLRFCSWCSLVSGVRVFLCVSVLRCYVLLRFVVCV